MQDFWKTVFEWIQLNFFTEWFIALLALFITILISAISQASSNRIARSDFIYRINADFADSDKIMKVYEWIENCRTTNKEIGNYRLLSEVFPKNNLPEPLSFADIDTYINHFEAVSVISKNNVKLKNIDRLFQQRFLTFMHNPYIQRQVLFPNFMFNDNLFDLYQKWTRLSYQRARFNSVKLAKYLNDYTCGNYEYTTDKIVEANTPLVKRLLQRWQQSKAIRYYLLDLCNPNCKMGYYYVKKGNDTLMVRIIPSRLSDLDELAKLELDIAEELKTDKHEDYYFCSGKKDIEEAICDPDCICLQIDVEDRIAAFAFVRLNPSEDQKFEKELNKFHFENSMLASGRVAVLETVFVAKGFRGYKLQSLLIDILCHLARYRGADCIRAVVHPDNKHSMDNLIENNSFVKATDTVEIERDKKYERIILRRYLSELPKCLGWKGRKAEEYYVSPDFSTLGTTISCFSKNQ